MRDVLYQGGSRGGNKKKKNSLAPTTEILNFNNFHYEINKKPETFLSNLLIQHYCQTDMADAVLLLPSA